MKYNLLKPTMCLFAYFILLSSSLVAGRHLDEKKLWEHVVTVDRLAWEEREGIKKINKTASDEDFVRRIYLDITGKIPTYDQMLAFRKAKGVTTRKQLIEDLLDSAGYVSNFSNFWLDLLRNPYRDPEGFNHKEFTRYVERFLHENKTYDKIVYDFVTAEGMLQHNPAVGFFTRDKETGPMDTVNATVRAFLGTRMGCAQCHNHRFDKWTQKEFYETAAHLWGVGYGESFSRRPLVFNFHKGKLKADSRYDKSLFGAYSSRILNPSRAKVQFNYKSNLTFPENYAYTNAKPKSAVTEKIVFGYGDENVEGENRREIFAKWMTSKNNTTFSRIMANRLWKRVMGVAVMEPIDDWKDNITVQNPKLFEALGAIFIDLDYDFKAFLSVLFNSEAYQYAIDVRNDFNKDDYKIQGATIKRMSAPQLSDSLLTLKHGNLDAYAKYDDTYFEFEDKLNKLAADFINEINPHLSQYRKKYGRDEKKYEYVEDTIMTTTFDYLEKLKELKDYYDFDEKGYLKSAAYTNKAMAMANSSKPASNKMATMTSTMANQSGSMMHAGPKGKVITRAHTKSSDLMGVFGSLDRSTPETTVDTGASMKQILKMMNSAECISVTGKDSYLMKEMKKKEKVSEKISFLYYSIYGRAPTKKDLNIALAFFKKGDKPDRWSKYTLALLNSPEFYFIK